MPAGERHCTLSKRGANGVHQSKRAGQLASPFEFGGGDEEDRTPDLRIANATLSQLSYVPDRARIVLNSRGRRLGRAG